MRCLLLSLCCIAPALAGCDKTQHTGEVRAGINAAAPKAVALAFAHAIPAHDAATLRAVTIGSAEQQAAVIAMAEMNHAFTMYEKAAAAKYGDAAKPRGQARPTLAETVADGEFRIDGDTAVMIRRGKADDPALRLRRVDGHWKVDLADFSKEAIRRKAMFSKVAEAANQVAAEIEGGEFADEEEALTALGNRAALAVVLFDRVSGGRR